MNCSRSPADPVSRKALQARPHEGRPSGAAPTIVRISTEEPCGTRLAAHAARGQSSGKPRPNWREDTRREGRIATGRRRGRTVTSGLGAAAGRLPGMIAGKPAGLGESRRTARRRPAKVRQIGSKTFYWKKERWTDSSVTQEEDEKATVMTQLSDEYFRLARTQKAENNQYLSLDEPVTVKLEGKVYRIDPAKN